MACEARSQVRAGVSLMTVKKLNKNLFIAIAIFFSYALGVAALTPEFWSINTTWQFRVINWIVLTILVDVVLHLTYSFINGINKISFLETKEMQP